MNRPRPVWTPERGLAPQRRLRWDCRTSDLSRAGPPHARYSAWSGQSPSSTAVPAPATPRSTNERAGHVLNKRVAPSRRTNTGNRLPARSPSATAGRGIESSSRHPRPVTSKSVSTTGTQGGEPTQRTPQATQGVPRQRDRRDPPGLAGPVTATASPPKKRRSYDVWTPDTYANQCGPSYRETKDQW